MKEKGKHVINNHSITRASQVWKTGECSGPTRHIVSKKGISIHNTHYVAFEKSKMADVDEFTSWSP